MKSILSQESILLLLIYLFDSMNILGNYLHIHEIDIEQSIAMNILGNYLHIHEIDIAQQSIFAIAYVFDSMNILGNYLHVHEIDIEQQSIFAIAYYLTV